MSYTKELQNIGLKKQEADIYLACLKLGMAKVSDLSKEVDIPRTSIYIYIDTLLEKGFLKKSKKEGTEYFVPVEPQDVLNSAKEKMDGFANILPQLEKMLDFAGKKPKIEFYDTKQGLLKINEKMLKFNFDKNHPVYAIESGASSANFTEKVGFEHLNKWQKKALEMQNDIVVQEVVTKDMVRYMQSIPEKNKETLRKRSISLRVIDEKDFPFSISLMFIHPSNIFIMVPQQNFVLVIDEKNTYNSLLTMFKLLYAKAEPIDFKAMLK